MPAVTCTAQASILTGKPPDGHGIVGNGWLFRETGEVRFWQQSNALIQAEPIYVTARRLAAERGRTFRAAKLFWWFNQGAEVEISVTPKPHYGADGNKVFGITGTPDGLTDRLERDARPVPVPHLLGPGRRPALHRLDRPMRGRACCPSERPDLTLVYLPHLDYDPQRFGPSGCDMPRLVGELDAACAPLLDAAAGRRRAGLGRQRVRPLRRQPARPAQPRPARGGPAHRPAGPVRRDPRHLQQPGVRRLRPSARPRLRPRPGRPRRASATCSPSEPGSRGSSSATSAASSAWTTRGPASSSPCPSPTPGSPIPTGSTTALAPDFARTVDIHRKPGYDPCELFFDPESLWPKGRALLRLLQKKLGFRTLFDVIPLDPTLVRGSHGLRAPARATTARSSSATAPCLR